MQSRFTLSDWLRKISKQIMLNILSWMDGDKDIDSIADMAELYIKILKDEWSLA